MRLVIDINEKDYEIMKHNIAINNPLCSLGEEEIVRKIANGTPLDKIRAEIMQVANQEKFHDAKWALGLRHAVTIIDKYKAESEESDADSD